MFSARACSNAPGRARVMSESRLWARVAAACRGRPGRNLSPKGRATPRPNAERWALPLTAPEATHGESANWPIFHHPVGDLYKRGAIAAVGMPLTARDARQLRTSPQGPRPAGHGPRARPGPCRSCCRSAEITEGGLGCVAAAPSAAGDGARARHGPRPSHAGRRRAGKVLAAALRFAPASAGVTQTGSPPPGLLRLPGGWLIQPGPIGGRRDAKVPPRPRRRRRSGGAGFDARCRRDEQPPRAVANPAGPCQPSQPARAFANFHWTGAVTGPSGEDLLLWQGPESSL